MRSTRRLLCLMLLTLAAACGAPGQCPPAFPNPAPGDLCCDAAWAWCQTADGRVIGAP